MLHGTRKGLWGSDPLRIDKERLIRIYKFFLVSTVLTGLICTLLDHLAIFILNCAVSWASGQAVTITFWKIINRLGIKFHVGGKTNLLQSAVGVICHYLHVGIS